MPCVNDLAFPYNPDNPSMTFCFLPPLFLPPPHSWYKVRTSPPHTGDIKFDLPPPLPTALWEEFWVVRSDYKYWVQMKGSSVLTCCHTDLWPLWFSLIIIISNSPHHHPQERVSDSFLVVVRYFSRRLLVALVWLSPLSAQSCFPALPLSVFGLRCATALPDPPTRTNMRTIWS